MDSEVYSKSWFGAFRHRPFPTLYPENKTPVTVDVLEVGWIVAFVTFALSVYVIVPGQRKSWLVLIRVTLALFLGLVIMLCNFGHQWEVGQLQTKVPYRAGTGQEIEADIGVWIGLRAVNITLKSDPPKDGDLQGETINYNERFSWAWGQGRAGFGPMAGRVQRDFRYHQQRGTPLPILWIAEYFTFDGEGFRFGRFYRLAGWYSHMCLWMALPTWFLSLILINMVIRYGARMLILTGALMVLSSILWSSLRIELEVPFDPPQGILRTKYGVHYWMALIVGLITIAYGGIIHGLDHCMHDKVCEWFGINPLIYPEYEVITQEEGEENQGVDAAGDIEMKPTSTQKSPSNLKKSITLRLRGRGTSSKNWKVQQITEEVEFQPQSASQSLLTPEPETATAQEADLGEYSSSRGHPPPTLPQIVTTKAPPS